MLKLNNTIDNSFSLFSKIGSFWASNLTDESRKQAKKLCYTSEIDTSIDTVRAHKDWLGNNNQLAYNFTWIINPKDVVVLGPDLEQRLVTVLGTREKTFRVVMRPVDWKVGTEGYTHISNIDKSNIFAIDDTLILIPDKNASDIVITDYGVFITKYIVKTPGFLPLALQATTGDVLFPPQAYEIRNGFVVFQQHPMELTEKAFTVIRGYRYSPSTMTYTLGLDTRCTEINWIMEYVRNNQSPSVFEKALNQLVGGHVIREDSVLLKKHIMTNGVYYYFDTYSVFVDYMHVHLLEFEVYNAGYIIGNLVRVYCEAIQGTSWYNEIKTSVGLDALCPIKGLVVTSFPKPLVHLAEFGGRAYMAIPVSQDTNYVASTNQVERYNAWVTSHPNNGLPSAIPQQYKGSPLSFLLDKVLKTRVMVIHLTTSRFGKTVNNSIIKFIDDNKPIGAVVIVEAVDSIPLVKESIELDDDIIVLTISCSTVIDISTPVIGVSTITCTCIYTTIAPYI